MKAPYYIVSDNHFFMKNDKNEKERREKLFSVFNNIKQKGKGTLIIGGDFFDYWFEYKDQIPSGYETLLHELKKLKESGIASHYILGNHDFWDFGYLKNNIGVETHKGDLKIKYNNKNIYFTHGDGILKNDYGYRFMKKIIRSKLFIRIYNLFNPNFTTKLANNISNTSSRYNHNNNNTKNIRNDVLEFAENKWKENFDMVLVGHYHQEGTIEKNKKSVTFLGDWLSKFTVTVIDDNGLWQGNWQKFLDLS
jgi:UDP-2,3-diacylglucosamine hydrolase